MIVATDGILNNELHALPTTSEDSVYMVLIPAPLGWRVNRSLSGQDTVIGLSQSEGGVAAGFMGVTSFGVCFGLVRWRAQLCGRRLIFTYSGSCNARLINPRITTAASFPQYSK